MSGSTPAWRVIAEREIFVRVRDKVFVGSTVFLLVGVIAAIVLSAVLGGRPDTYELGVVDRSAQTIGAAAQERLRAQSGNEDVVATRMFDDPEAVEQAVRDGEVEAALLPADGGYEVVGDTTWTPGCGPRCLLRPRTW
jgi:ABC-2 type transport system permease protein